MTQQPIELILIRRWASYINSPLFIAGPEGRLLYYNDAAARLLGQPFDAVGDLDVSDLPRVFHTRTGDGRPVGSDDLPIQIALASREACHRSLRITGLDGVSRQIDITAMPLIGQAGRFLGAMAFFWEANGR